MKRSMMVLTKRSTLLGLFIFLSHFLPAQSSLSNDGRWEIGVDFLPLIDTTHFVENSILIRRVIGDRSKLRTRVGISFKEIKSQERTSLSDADMKSSKPFQSYLSLGYERYLLTGRVSVFAGTDVFGTYYRDIRHLDINVRANGTPLEHYVIDDKKYEYRVGLNFFTGVNVRITPRLYIATETFLQTAYRWQKSDYVQYQGFDLHLGTSGGNIIKRLIVDLQPVSAIYLFYQF